MKKKGFTLIELMVAVAILVMVFIALYDLYISSFKLYSNDQNKAKVEMEVKNFSDSIYDYLKSSYQDSIEVASVGDGDVISENVLDSDKNSILMAVYQKGDPSKYLLKGEIVKVEMLQNSYKNNGILPKILTGQAFNEVALLHGECCKTSQCSSKNKNYHYIMFTQREENGEKYIETISNISKGQDITGVDDNRNIPGIKTKTLSGIVEGFRIKPTYNTISENLITKKVLNNISITIDYSYGKGKTESLTLDYTIRN